MLLKHTQEDTKGRGLGILPIGIISALVGYVAIKGPDGIEKLLKLGEKLFSNDEIVTGEDGHAVIDLADGSRLQLNPDSGVVLDEDVIDAQLLASIAPDAGEQSTGGFAVTRMDIQEQVAATSGQQGEPGRATGPDAVTPNTFIAPTDPFTPGNDSGANDAPDTNPQPPDNPVGKIPTLSVADVVVIEPPPSGSQGESGGGGHESGEEGGDEHTDSGHDSGSDSHASDSSHDSDAGHDSGGDSHDSGSDAGGHGEQAPVYAVFTIVLSAPALTDVMVDFSTANGTAIAGGRGVNENDFGQTQGTLTIPRGEISGTITVEIMGDRGVEPDNEYFYINLSNARGATIADGQAVASIIDSGHGDGSTGAGDVITGTSGDDVLTGSGGRDTIYGDSGDDTMFGRGGPDTLFGGDGDDDMQGMGGPDTMSGGAGNDVMLGQGGRDVMDGGPGNDILDGGGSPDSLIGGEGNDALYGGGGPDLLDGGPGNDILVGGGAGDIFRFDNFDAVDSVIDFKPQQGDVLDISALIEGFNPADPIGNYVQLQQTGDTDNYELLVNPSGSSADDFQLLVTLENFSHAASVDDLVDNGNLIVSDMA